MKAEKDETKAKEIFKDYIMLKDAPIVSLNKTPSKAEVLSSTFVNKKL